MNLLFLIPLNSSGEKRIVVLDFVISTGLPYSISTTLVDSITNFLKGSQYRVMERKVRDTILKMERYKPPPMLNEHSISTLRNILNVDIIIWGSILAHKKHLLVSISIIDAEKGKLIGGGRKRLLLEEVNNLPNSVYEIIGEILNIKKSFETYKRKSVGVAWALSFLIGFGTGNFYAEAKTAGTIFLLGEMGTAMCTIIGLFDSSIKKTSECFIGWILLRTIDWIYSIPATYNYNIRQEKTKRRSILILPMVESKKAGIGIRIKF